MTLISQFGATKTPIRINTKQIRAKPALSEAERDRSTSGVRLLNADDRVAAAMVFPPEDPKTNGEGTLLQ